MTIKEGMKEVIKVVKRAEPPKDDARTLAFIMKSQDQDHLAHISIPPPHIEAKELTPKSYQIKKEMVGNPTVDKTKVMIITCMKEVF